MPHPASGAGSCKSLVEAAFRQTGRGRVDPRCFQSLTPNAGLNHPCFRAGVTLHGGERAAATLGLPAAPSARHEYSSLDCTLELVSGLDQAIDHIHTHGSGHTESIITGAWAARAGPGRADAAECSLQH